MGKNLPANAGHEGSIPGSERSPGEGNGNSLQYSCLGNPIDRGAWQATVHGVTKSQTRLRTQQQRHVVCTQLTPSPWKCNPPNSTLKMKYLKDIKRKLIMNLLSYLLKVLKG